MKFLFSLILYKWLGWKTDVTVPERKQCIMCVVPHTSNWDFIYAILFDRSYGGRAHFLMKKQWFFWPLGVVFRYWGGVAVDRKNKHNLTDDLAQQFHDDPNFRLAITPEGTRSANPNWKHGFYHIAQKANVAIRLYVLDYSTKTIRCNKEIWPSGNVENDIAEIKNYYGQFKNAAKYPSKFSI